MNSLVTGVVWYTEDNDAQWPNDGVSWVMRLARCAHMGW